MSELIKVLDAPEAERLAERRGGRAPLMVERCSPGRLRLERFTNRDGFLDIAWQEVPDTRFLTERRTRTLQAVAERILSDYGSFGALVRSQHLSINQRAAFQACADMEEKIRTDGYTSFEWFEPWLVPAVPGDNGSPTTEWYVAEGVHSTIVRAVELVRDSKLWQPAHAVVCCDRVV
jgi:hypothetical protein